MGLVMSNITAELACAACGKQTRWVFDYYRDTSKPLDERRVINAVGFCTDCHDSGMFEIVMMNHRVETAMKVSGWKA